VAAGVVAHEPVLLEVVALAVVVLVAQLEPQILEAVEVEVLAPQ
jgi:hypothetical protein